MISILRTLMYCALYMIVLANFQFNPVPNGTPIIVNRLANANLAYDSYKLVFFADLTPFNKLKANIKSAVQTITNLTTILNKPTYTSAAAQLQHQWDLIYSNEELLDSFRTRRFVLCEFCGKLQHHLYGVMDAATDRQYDSVINGIRNASLQNRELIRNQSEIFQATLHFNKNTFARFESTIKQLATHLNNQTDDISVSCPLVYM